MTSILLLAVLMSSVSRGWNFRVHSTIVQQAWEPLPKDKQDAYNRDAHALLGRINMTWKGQLSEFPGMSDYSRSADVCEADG